MISNLDKIGNIDKIKGINQEIKVLKRRIKELENQKKQLELVSKSSRRNCINCNKCGSNNLCIKFKGNGTTVKLIGLYCIDCMNKSSSEKKKTGYIKFLSKEEYLKIKMMQPDIKEFHEESKN